MSIVDCRSVRHKAQGVLAHILGRLPCSKKTPKKIGNSMLAQCRYRMKIRKAGNICRIINCPTKICKDRHKLANCNAIRILYHNGKIQFAEASTALHYQKRKIPQNRNPLQNSRRNYVSATPQAGALRHIQMAWPNQRANVSDVPREMKRA